jgi:transcriptional regulator with XRE-family HTH domain
MQQPCREAMTLQELRKARSLPQEEVAEALTVNQPAVAKLKKRGDMHVSNLRRYIEALGGTLEITPKSAAWIVDLPFLVYSNSRLFNGPSRLRGHNGLSNRGDPALW